MTDPEVVITNSSPSYRLFTRTVSSWDAALVEFASFDSGWIFRGHRDANWDLRCNLDRLRGGVEPSAAEWLLYEQFTQRAHLFLPTHREPADILEWLALIQHHGGPTRLIDFTRSPFVAAFFALEEEGNEPMCAVWALENYPCRTLAAARIAAMDPAFSWLKPHHSIEDAVVRQVARTPAQPFVAPIEGPRLNSRMALQQGVFLCLGDPGMSLFANLEVEVPGVEPLRVVKVQFPRNRNRGLPYLRRMNIRRDTLFPGLDGLAQSLAHLLIQAPALEALVHAITRPPGWPGPASQDE